MKPKNNIAVNWYGQRRILQKYTCGNCGKDFLSRKQKGHKNRFCSCKCSSVFKGKTFSIRCASCDIEFDVVESTLKKSKHGLHFCSRKCKEYAQSLKGGFTKLQPSHYGTAQKSYRDIARRRLKSECVCGIKYHGVLLVHHVDGDRDNNDISNLEILCPTCHVIRHMENIDGEWQFKPAALTPRDKLDEIYAAVNLSQSGATAK